jgi:iron complex transport system substrate-binding protein
MPSSRSQRPPTAFLEVGVFRPGGRKALAAAFLAACLLSAALPARALPVAEKDDRGVVARLAAPPARVVSLAPNLTEIVFLLGQQGKLVGVTRYCNFPPAAASLPRIGGMADPDLERIVAAEADLVLCTTDGNPRDRVLALEKAGIPAFCLAPQDLSGVAGAVERVGRLLGVPDKGAREAERLRERTARAGRRPAGTPPKVLFLLSTRPLIAAGRGTFLDEILLRAGGQNAAGSLSGRYPRLSVEALLALSPDVVFVASLTRVERLPADVTRWKEVPAFRDGFVVYLDGDLVTRPGPRMVSALEEVSRALSDREARLGGRSPGAPGGKPR